jgi:hypothetical protein
LRQTAARTREILAEVTRRGRLDLHKFGAALQAKLEGYLDEPGIPHRADA